MQKLHVGMTWSDVSWHQYVKELSCPAVLTSGKAIDGVDESRFRSACVPIRGSQVTPAVQEFGYLHDWVV